MSGEDESGWQLTESDPGVFTELLNTLGVPLVVDDLYSLDDASLAHLQPIRALIFLFKWLPGPSEGGPQPHAGTPSPHFPGFFAHQVVNNACATLAVLNAVANIPSAPRGPDLTSLLSFASDMDPQTRGLVVTSADWLRAAHNALSPPSAISLDGLGLPRSKSEDAYHFVVYLPLADRVYELDGLKPHALDHGPVGPAGDWLATARAAVERRIATYPPGALEFNLQAVHDDPLPMLEAELARAQEKEEHVQAAALVDRLEAEREKRAQWAFENALRRHNHLGFIHALVLALAKGGKLDAAAAGAREKMDARLAKARARGEDMDED